VGSTDAGSVEAKTRACFPCVAIQSLAHRRGVGGAKNMGNEQGLRRRLILCRHSVAETVFVRPKSMKMKLPNSIEMKLPLRCSIANAVLRLTRTVANAQTANHPKTTPQEQRNGR
jgi:hypothetical protein